MNAVVSPRLVCLGNLTFDDVVLPDGTVRTGCVGGDAFYAAAGARLWEPRVELVAPRGDDLPAGVLAQLAGVPFSLAGVPQRAVQTMHNRVEYDGRGGRTWTYYTPAADHFVLSPRPADIPAAYLEPAAFLVSAMDLDAQEELVRWLKAHTTATVALDLQEHYIPGNEDRLRALVPRVDVFLPSEEEVRRLLGHENWLEAARHWSALGPRLVVIKCGASGCLVYDAAADRAFEMAAFPAAAVDTTGAGDAFCGGFLAALIQQPDRLDRAARAGAVSASFAVEGFGVEPLLRARPADVAARLARWDEKLPPPPGA